MKSESHNSIQTFSSRPSGHPLIHPVGVGLRSAHYQDILDTKPDLGWFEVHPENYFCGGVHRHYLDQISEHYALSMHGVGLSLGADQPVSAEHLRQFKELIDTYNPFIVSDHVAWSASGNAHLNDLLPLPYTQETLDRLARNVHQVQQYFGRSILVENPSTYIAFKDNEMSEQEFMNRLCDQTGCSMLLDINNIYVQSHNHGLDPVAYIGEINPDFVMEMHLAGHIEKAFGTKTLLIDTHNQTVCDAVWDLYAVAVAHVGAVPTLIEWDQDIPALQVLTDQAEQARTIIERVVVESYAHAAE